MKVRCLLIKMWSIKIFVDEFFLLASLVLYYGATFHIFIFLLCNITIHGSWWYICYLYVTCMLLFWLSEQFMPLISETLVNVMLSIVCVSFVWKSVYSWYLCSHFYRKNNPLIISLCPYTMNDQLFRGQKGKRDMITVLCMWFCVKANVSCYILCRHNVIDILQCHRHSVTS